jgi:hypothetical protein
VLIKCGNDNGSGVVQYCNPDTGERLFSAQVASCTLSALCCTEGMLAVGSEDGLVQVFDMEELIAIAAFGDFDSIPRSMSFSEGGRMLSLVQEDDRTIRLYSIQEEKMLECLRFRWRVSVAAWHPSALVLAVSADVRHKADDDSLLQLITI